MSSSHEILTKGKNNQQIVIRSRGKGIVNWAECRQAMCQAAEFWTRKTFKNLKKKIENLNLESFVYVGYLKGWETQSKQKKSITGVE